VTKPIRLIAIAVLIISCMGPTAVAQASGPAADTDDATLVTDTTARLNGEVDPNGDTTTAWFEYGTTTSYGSSSGSLPFSMRAPVFHVLRNLTPGTVYHFRLRAVNVRGSAAGTDHTFTTTGTAPVAPAPAAPAPAPALPGTPAPTVLTPATPEPVQG
jgi:hypothetical protein